MNAAFKLGFQASLVAVALGFTGASQATIKGSKHDLGQGGAAQAVTSLTTEVCVFCHTPHGSVTTAAVPLWNKTLPPSDQYTRYSSLGTATLDGAEVAVGSVSIACLSCHDGTQAMDVMINTPGSGTLVGASDRLGPGFDVAAIDVMQQNGTFPFPNLGTDLTNDHPVSIAYAGGSCVETTADCTPRLLTGAGDVTLGGTGDPDFSTAQYQLLNGQHQWWVDTTVVDTATGNTLSTPNVREKTDMILYTRDFGDKTLPQTDANFTAPGPSVECASCHDPHEADARPVSFMRISNNGSAVCLACHTK